MNPGESPKSWCNSGGDWFQENSLGWISGPAECWQGKKAKVQTPVSSRGTGVVGGSWYLRIWRAVDLPSIWQSVRRAVGCSMVSLRMGDPSISVYQLGWDILGCCYATDISHPHRSPLKPLKFRTWASALRSKEKGLLIDKGHDTYAPWRVQSFQFDLADAFEWAFWKQLLYAFAEGKTGSTSRHQRV